MILINIATPKRDISKLSSYNDAALQVLMSVCLSVCVSVCLQVEILPYSKVPQGSYRLPMVKKVPHSPTGTQG